eukprot:CAMPEP_0119050740 /NCGR_PEP_ID=MMETSP1177-20130426/71437_1 /TAXON_ID=2985 /ORGANISM="Ochromonas sp, Strain CCMP1899" /LENGTH=191 /DNA_ID=CAMNT_0007029465 /DNA_START=92 /DNA_END=667 /DNA_ORIENTATION=+
MQTTSSSDSSTLVRQPVVLDIADDSDSLLRMISLPVEEKEIKSIEIQNLISDMVATMYAAPGVGLAAPQIRILKRIIVFYLPASRDDLDGVGIPLTVLINPNMEIIDETILKDFEGCLSVPGKRGKVGRAKKIKYSGLDANGEYMERIAEGWHARIFQHEYDHLNGILYTGLMALEDSLLTSEEYKLLIET